MKRVLITGSGGAGKSTFAKSLGAKSKLPVIHLDYYFHQTDKDYINNSQAWIEKVNDLLRQASWIMEGNYSSTYEERFALADTFIFLDIPTRVTLWSVIVRRYKFRNKNRPEMPDDWEEKLNWPFVKYIINFNRDSRNKLVSEIEKYSHDNLDVLVFKSRKAAYKWLADLSEQ